MQYFVEFVRLLAFPFEGKVATQLTDEVFSFIHTCHSERSDSAVEESRVVSGKVNGTQCVRELKSAVS